MTPPSVDVVANDVSHLAARVEKLEAKLEASLRKGDIQTGVAVGFGAIMTLLLPKIAEVLGLS
jgi:hypothetical protein